MQPPIEPCHRVELYFFKKNYNPFATDIWGLGKCLTEKDVERAIHGMRFHTKPQGDASWKVMDHAMRIAYFVVYGIQDPVLEVDVGVPSLGFNPEWIITDGNHRLAAMLYLGNPLKEVGVSLSGDLDYAKDLGFIPFSDHDSTV
jgi:hypothetical protein